MFDKYLAWVMDSFQSEQGFCLKWPLAWFCFEKDVKGETLAKEETFTSISQGRATDGAREGNANKFDFTNCL